MLLDDGVGISGTPDDGVGIPGIPWSGRNARVAWISHKHRHFLTGFPVLYRWSISNSTHQIPAATTLYLSYDNKMSLDIYQCVIEDKNNRDWEPLV